MFVVALNTLRHYIARMPQFDGLALETDTFDWRHWLAVVLALLTGVFHVYAGAIESRIPVALAGVGFLVAIGLFLVDYRRQQLYLVGIVYTFVQLPLWYVVKAGEYTMVGYLDKTVQVLLILVLAALYWESRQATERPAAA